MDRSVGQQKFLYYLYFFDWREKRQPCTVRQWICGREKKLLGRAMMHSYKPCIKTLLEPIKVDINRTQAKNKTQTHSFECEAEWFSRWAN